MAKSYLNTLGQVSVDLVDLVDEALVQHFIGLIDDKNFDIASTKMISMEHVQHTTGSAADALNTEVPPLDVGADLSAADAGVTLDLEILTDGEHNLLGLLGELTGGGQDDGLGLHDCVVDASQNTDAEHTGLSGT